MKRLFFIAACAALLLHTPARAAELTAQQRARIALALASTSRPATARSACNCTSPLDCTCPPGTCTCPNCAGSAKRPGTPKTGKVCYCDDPASCPCTDPNCVCVPTTGKKAQPKGSVYMLYGLACEAAISQGRPMLVWVGTVCPSCEQKMTEYIHYRAGKSFDGDDTPRVIVSVPKSGQLYEAHVFRDAIPTPEDVRSAIALFDNKYQRIAAARTQAQQPVLGPQLQPQAFFPPPMMMGGLGGGFGGGCGGCGGGG